MKINLKYILCLLGLVANIEAFCETGLQIQNWKTDDGAQALFYEEDELPILDIVVIFDAGAMHDGENLGIASFTNNMLNEVKGSSLDYLQVVSIFNPIYPQPVDSQDLTLYI